MCILFLKAFGDKQNLLAPAPRYKLILAFNREERLERPTAPLSRWTLPGGITVLSGMDMEHGGTWLAVDQQGRLVALTNNREPPIRHGCLVSRGVLTLFYFESQSMEDFRQRLLRSEPAVPKFNIVYGNVRSGCFDFLGSGSSSGGIEEARGVGLRTPLVISNSSIASSSSWSKISRGYQLFDQFLADLPSLKQPQVIENLFALLHDTEKTTTGSLTNTTLPPEIEAKLCSVFLEDSIEVEDDSKSVVRYATLSSSVILVDWDDQVTFVERTWNPDGTYSDSQETMRVRQID